MLFIFSAYRPDILHTEATNACGFKNGIFGYRVKTIRAGGYIDVECYPIYKGLPAQRAKRRIQSRWAQEKLNEKNSVKQLTRLLNANFGAGDVWLTLTYSNAHLPATAEQAKKDGINYIRRLRRVAGKNLKYVIVTETHDKDGAIVRAHHHIITDFRDRDTAERLWKKGRRNQSRILAPDEYGLAGMAHYIAKQDRQSGQRRWRASKNLKKPTVTVADHKLGKLKAAKLATGSEGRRKEYFERSWKARYLDCTVKYSDIVAGTYLYVRMRR